MALPVISDRRLEMPLSTALTSGARLSTTSPLVVATAVLFPFRMLISCLCADVLAAIQSCWNAWLVRMLLISLSAKPARPLLSGRARIAAARGSVLAAQRRRSP
jgi:hypothetical protein